MTIRMWAGMVGMFLATAGSAFAAEGRVDHSGVLVWIFLGFCALIVVAQLVPVFLMAFGIVKGGIESTREMPAETPPGQQAAKH